MFKSLLSGKNVKNTRRVDGVAESEWGRTCWWVSESKSSRFLRNFVFLDSAQIYDVYSIYNMNKSKKLRSWGISNGY